MMDEQQMNKEAAAHSKAKMEMRMQMKQQDASMHGEGGMAYDHKTGTLKPRKK
jgi:hypothetical protein